MSLNNLTFAILAVLFLSATESKGREFRCRGTTLLTWVVAQGGVHRTNSFCPPADAAKGLAAVQALSVSAVMDLKGNLDAVPGNVTTHPLSLIGRK